MALVSVQPSSQEDFCFVRFEPQNAADTLRAAEFVNELIGGFGAKNQIVFTYEGHLNTYGIRGSAKDTTETLQRMGLTVHPYVPEPPSVAADAHIAVQAQQQGVQLGSYGHSHATRLSIDMLPPHARGAMGR